MGESWKVQIPVRVRVAEGVMRTVNLLRTYRLKEVNDGIGTITFATSIDRSVKNAAIKGQLIQSTPQGTITFSFCADDPGDRQGLVVRDANQFEGGGNHFMSMVEKDTLRVRFQDESNSAEFIIPGINGDQEYEVAAFFGPDGVGHHARLDEGGSARLGDVGERAADIDAQPDSCFCHGMPPLTFRRAKFAAGAIVAFRIADYKRFKGVFSTMLPSSSVGTSPARMFTCNDGRISFGTASCLSRSVRNAMNSSRVLPSPT